jgi:DNA polymerase-3 subunit epsilon
VIVFTGALQSMTRQDPWDAAVGVGASPEKNVTRRTDVVVIGGFDPAHLRPGSALSEKARKALAMQDKGQDIEVLTEADFVQCLGGAPPDAPEILLRHTGPGLIGTRDEHRARAEPAPAAAASSPGVEADHSGMLG